ncbi:MAG: hypothetical protein WA624_10485 [Methylocella sp.]
MPNGTSSGQETIEATIAPFYHAIGRATARWQHVEAGLFVLVHAIMQTDYKYSSVVFLHIQSAASKVKLVDSLCHAHFDKTIIKNEWTPLLKDLNSAVAVRNSIAHWEANFILDVSVLEPWESPIALTPHHLDVRAQADTRGATTNTLNQTAEEFLALANRLLRFVAPHFSDKALRATNLPRRCCFTLRTIETTFQYHRSRRNHLSSDLNSRMRRVLHFLARRTSVRKSLS